ncbi:uncharacterized protein LOC129046671 isoform X1 [Molothrus ater]|uniref:uncharacterized protein LOC129046671 isoform X1 n=1 Tax=Molothrus ater TaxID=84834 RepID=UPI0023E7E5A6|nr:uncharacterized protein LOC129046671 isoform X1 [Molothrus ater]
MRLQRASRGAASGWRKAKGPTRWHQGTCEEQNGHLEATWRKGMHSFVFSTPPVAPTWESFPSLLHFQLDPWKTPNSIPLIFRCQRHEGLLPFSSSWPPPALRSQPAGTQPGNTKEHGWQPAGDTEAPGPEKQPWPQQPASFGAGSTHLQATPPSTLQKSFGHGARSPSGLVLFASSWGNKGTLWEHIHSCWGNPGKGRTIRAMGKSLVLPC